MAAVVIASLIFSHMRVRYCLLDLRQPQGVNMQGPWKEHLPALYTGKRACPAHSSPRYLQSPYAQRIPRAAGSGAP